jgi:hypothetical protein
MDPSLLAILVIILVFYLVLPVDFYLLVETCSLSVKMLVLNYYLMFQAWRIHRLICRDLARIGMAKPAFKFTPLWER